MMLFTQALLLWYPPVTSQVVSLHGLGKFICVLLRFSSCKLLSPKPSSFTASSASPWETLKILSSSILLRDLSLKTFSSFTRSITNHLKPFPGWVFTSSSTPNCLAYLGEFHSNLVCCCCLFTQNNSSLVIRWNLICIVKKTFFTFCPRNEYACLSLLLLFRLTEVMNV